MAGQINELLLFFVRFSSQHQAFKALTAIARAEEHRPPQAIASKAAAHSAKASGKGAARCAFGGKRTRTGPVWRASGPFVSEALRLMNSVDETLRKLVSRGYPLALQARTVHEGVERLRYMLDRRIDDVNERHDDGYDEDGSSPLVGAAGRRSPKNLGDAVARQVPASKINATSVSPKSQAADRQRLRFLRDGRANK